MGKVIRVRTMSVCPESEASLSLASLPAIEPKGVALCLVGVCDLACRLWHP